MSVNWDWVGKEFNVKVLFSVAGVASQILIQSRGEDSFLLVDAGDGIVRDLLELPGQIFEKISTIAITHGHFDHVGGIFSLLSIFRLAKRNETLNIISPPDNSNLKNMINVFTEYYKQHQTFEINFVEAKDISLKFGSFVITPFLVQHRSSLSPAGKKMSAVGYRISKNKETILYTGDTGYFEQLEKLVKDIDLALIETTFIEKKEDYHLTLFEAKRLSELAKDYIFVHVPTHVHFKNLKEREN